MRRKPWIRVLAAPTACVFAAVLVGGCTSSGSSNDPLGDGQGFVTSEGTASRVPIQERVSAPDISGATLDGGEMTLSQFDGQVIVVNVWASWCGPCRAEAQALREVANETERDGVQFVGLNTRDNDAAAQAYERGFDIQYPSWVDRDGQLQLAFRDSLPPSEIPSTVVIDREGRVAARVLGPTSYSQLKELVAYVSDERN